MRALVIPICLAALTAACDSEPPIRISRDSETAQRGQEGPLRVIETLQCPQTHSVLTRRGSPAADGLSCEYTGPRGSQVTLRLVRYEGDPATALQALETEIQALLPTALNRVGGATVSVDAATGDDASGSAGDRADVRLPGVSVQAQGDTATVRIPGISIDTDGAGSSVRIGGFRIRSDDVSGDVDISTDNESVQIRTNDRAAEIRTRDLGHGVRATYILVDERGSELDWRLVGYEARGPQDAPLVVAIVRSKDRREDEVFDAAKSLVRLNVGE